jgi:SlyX protein
MSGTDDLRERLERLETIVAFQERTIAELNETVTQQWSELDLLKREVKNLKAQLREVEANPALAPGTEPPPPHY